MEVVINRSQNISSADMQLAKGILVIMLSLTLSYIPYYVFATLVSMDTSKHNGVTFAY